MENNCWKGSVRANSGAACGMLVLGHEQPVPIFQQLARGHPSGRDDVRQIPAVAAQQPIQSGAPGRYINRDARPHWRSGAPLRRRPSFERGRVPYELTNRRYFDSAAQSSQDFSMARSDPFTSTPIRDAIMPSSDGQPSVRFRWKRSTSLSAVRARSRAKNNETNLYSFKGLIAAATPYAKGRTCSAVDPEGHPWFFTAPKARYPCRVPVVAAEGVVAAPARGTTRPSTPSPGRGGDLDRLDLHQESCGAGSQLSVYFRNKSSPRPIISPTNSRLKLTDRRGYHACIAL